MVSLPSTIAFLLLYVEITFLVISALALPAHNYETSFSGPKIKKKSFIKYMHFSLQVEKNCPQGFSQTIVSKASLRLEASTHWDQQEEKKKVHTEVERENRKPRVPEHNILGPHPRRTSSHLSSRSKSFCVVQGLMLLMICLSEY